MIRNGGVNRVKDISAQKEAEADGARLQEKNEYGQRQESIKETQVKGKKSAFSVRPHACGLFLSLRQIAS